MEKSLSLGFLSLQMHQLNTTDLETLRDFGKNGSGLRGRASSRIRGPALFELDHDSRNGKLILKLLPKMGSFRVTCSGRRYNGHR